MISLLTGNWTLCQQVKKKIDTNNTNWGEKSFQSGMEWTTGDLGSIV